MPYMKVLTTILSITAIVVAYRSYVISKQALSISENSATLSSRPYLIVAAHKPKDRDSFISFSEKNGGGELEVWFTVENKGSTPAYAVRVDESKMKVTIVDEHGRDKTDEMNLNLQFPEEVSIGPHHIIDLAARFFIPGVNNHNHQEQLKKGVTLPIEITISYDGVFGEKRTRYTSPYKAELSHDRAKIVSSGM